MTYSEISRRIYTVVEVWRGIAVGAKNFGDLRDAHNYVRRLERRCNLLEDDVRLFEGRVRLPQRRRKRSLPRDARSKLSASAEARTDTGPDKSRRSRG